MHPNLLVKCVHVQIKTTKGFEIWFTRLQVLRVNRNIMFTTDFSDQLTLAQEGRSFGCTGFTSTQPRPVRTGTLIQFIM